MVQSVTCWTRIHNGDSTGRPGTCGLVQRPIAPFCLPLKRTRFVTVGRHTVSGCFLPDSDCPRTPLFELRCTVNAYPSVRGLRLVWKGNEMIAIQLLPIETLRAMKPEDIDALARASVDVQKKAKDATDAHKSSFPATGKVVCVLEERLNELKSRKLIASNTSLATYFESITKNKINPHASSCANAFGTYVRTGLISEKDYDLNSENALSLGSSISTAVGGDILNAAVFKAAEELKERGKNQIKNLRAILETVKEPKELDAQKASEMVATVIKHGHLEIVLAIATAALAYEKDEKRLKSCFAHLLMGMDRCGTQVQQDAWVLEKEKANTKAVWITPAKEEQAQAAAMKAAAQEALDNAALAEMEKAEATEQAAHENAVEQTEIPAELAAA